MKLIVGLGNLGTKYALTRHNAGFMAIDALAHRLNNTSFKQEHKALVSKQRIGSTTFLMAKPQTYMNCSGESVQALMSYYDIALEDLLIAHDEIDLDLGILKFQKNRGHGGNNGIRSIHHHLGTHDYCRLKIGVGRPKNSKQDVASYVLEPFLTEEQNQFQDVLGVVVESLLFFVENNYNLAATRFNGKPI